MAIPPAKSLNKIFFIEISNMSYKNKIVIII